MTEPTITQLMHDNEKLFKKIVELKEAMREFRKFMTEFSNDSQIEEIKEHIDKHWRRLL